MSEQPCRTCGQPGQTVPVKVEGEVVGEATLHEDDEGVMSHVFPYTAAPLPPEEIRGKFSFRVPGDDLDDWVPWSRRLPPPDVPVRPPDPEET
jgi:hypothetical protein